MHKDKAQALTTSHSSADPSDFTERAIKTVPTEVPHQMVGEPGLQVASGASENVIKYNFCISSCFGFISSISSDEILLAPAILGRRTHSSTQLDLQGASPSSLLLAFSLDLRKSLYVIQVINCATNAGWFLIPCCLCLLGWVLTVLGARDPHFECKTKPKALVKVQILGNYRLQSKTLCFELLRSLCVSQHWEIRVRSP